MTDYKEVALEAFRFGANGFIGKFGGPSVVYLKLKECIEKSNKKFTKSMSLELKFALDFRILGS